MVNASENLEKCSRAIKPLKMELEKRIREINYAAFGIGGLSIVLNIILAVAVTVVLRKREDTWRRFIFLRNLAVSDIICGAALVVAAAVRALSGRHGKREERGELYAAISELLKELAIFAPVVNCIGIELLQYFALRHPLTYHVHFTRRHCRAMIIGQWATICGLLAVMGARLGIENNANKNSTNSTRHAYFLVIVSLCITKTVFFLLLFLTAGLSYAIFCKIMICRHLQRSHVALLAHRTMRRHRSRFALILFINVALMLFSLLSTVVANLARWPSHYRYMSDVLAVGLGNAAPSCDMFMNIENLFRVKSKEVYTDLLWLVRMLSDPLVHLALNPQLRAVLLRRKSGRLSSSRVNNLYSGSAVSAGRLLPKEHVATRSRILAFGRGNATDGYEIETTLDSATVRGF